MVWTPLADHNEDFAGLDSSALIDANLLDGAVAGGEDFIFHLHRFKNQNNLAVLDGVAGLDKRL